MATLDFGITLKLEMPPERAVALASQAEAAGFSYGWVFDSHVLWLDPYPVLTQMAASTTRMRFGTCVTNPATRDPTVTASTLATLNLISGGRMDLGIGRGDSAQRVLNRKPTTVAALREATTLIKELASGREVTIEGAPVRLDWAPPYEVPAWVAAYGPRVLNLAGQVADGVILQIADPDLIAWFLTFVKQGAEEAGRDFSAIKVMAAAPAWVSDDLPYARERVRWFPALVSNHVVDLVSKYDPAELPPALTGYIRSREGYDYQHHAEVGSSNAAFVSDEVVDRFCVIGPPEAHKQRLQQLVDVGVHQFNIYLMNGEEEACVAAYGRDIIPHMIADY